MYVVVSLNDVGSVAVSVGNHYRNDGTAIVSHCDLVTLIVTQNKKVSMLAIDSGLEVFTLQTTDVACLFCVHIVSVLG